MKPIAGPLLMLAVIWLTGCEPEHLPEFASQASQAESTFVAPPIATDIDPADDVVHVELQAQILETSDDGTPTRFGYNGSSPGPTIEARVGDLVVVDFANETELETTIHWHGLHVPNEMDGVPMIQGTVPPGETFRYEFVVRQEGTFWYHPHFDTDSQVDLGLYGAFVVRDPSQPAPDEEIVLILDTPNEDVPVAQTAHGSGHGRLATEWLVNGVSVPELELPAGSVVRARVVNVSNAGYLELTYRGLRQIGSDQGIWHGVESPQSVVLGPGDRAELEILLGEDPIVVQNAPYSLNGGRAHGDPSTVVTLLPTGTGDAPSGLAWNFDDRSPSLDPGFYDVLYQFAGSDRSAQWYINGEQTPNIPVEEIPLGEASFIEVRNLSPTEHPFHIHGMDFEVVSIDGEPVDHTIVEDTWNVGIRQTIRVRVEPQNEGMWMTHCHILPHAEDGMMTMLRVE